MQGHGMDPALREFSATTSSRSTSRRFAGSTTFCSPTEAIDEAQELAAEAYGADHSFFLINGSTSGNQIMMMAALNPGEKIACRATRTRARWAA
jgi:arginine decarboxylase